MIEGRFREHGHGALPPWVRPPVLKLEPKYADASLDYLIRIPFDLDPYSDFLSAASVQVAPSGPAELTISQVRLVASGLVFTVAGGQPRRIYTLKFLAAATSGRVFEWIGRLAIPPVLRTDAPSLAGYDGWSEAVSAVIGALTLNGSVVNSTDPTFAITDLGLERGVVWSNGGEIDIVPGYPTNLRAPRVTVDQMTVPGLLMFGAGDFPQVSPPRGSRILWNNEDVLCAA